MDFGSILWLEESLKIPINQQVIKDLNLLNVYDKLVSNEDILYHLIQDRETLTYRQEIMEDFMSIDGLTGDLVDCLVEFENLKPLFIHEKQHYFNIYRLIDLLIIIEKSVKVLDELNQTLYYYKVSSHGLKALKSNVESIINADSFKEMKQDLKAIKYIFSTIRSATLSVNMNVGMRPVFAQVTSLDDHRFRYPKAFRKVSDVLRMEPMFLGQLLSSYAPVFKVNKLNYDLMEEIEFALREHQSQLKTFVTKYEQIDVEPFIRLLDEIRFYEASVGLFKKIEAGGLPFTRPEFDFESKSFSMEVKGFYNLNLAVFNDEHEKSETIIKNDVAINDQRIGTLITGANRGGKTTFTQGIGQVQLLGQMGLYVPAISAKLSVSNGILTHFPVSESETYDKGKFGKECQLFVEKFKEAGRMTLFLMNESFTGTSHMESLNIAAEGCMALVHNRYAFVFNTHLHELYQYLRESLDEKDKSLIYSLVTEMEEGQSSYKLIEREPYGQSFARKIALKYGVTLEQLREVSHETGN